MRIHRQKLKETHPSFFECRFLYYCDFTTQMLVTLSDPTWPELGNNKLSHLSHTTAYSVLKTARQMCHGQFDFHNKACSCIMSS